MELMTRQVDLDCVMGETLLLTNGEYSDYGIVRLVRVVKSFNLREEVSKLSETWEESALVQSFIDNGLVTDEGLNYREFNIECAGHTLYVGR